jgi:deoxycytidylate deaminase
MRNKILSQLDLGEQLSLKETKCLRKGVAASLILLRNRFVIMRFNGPSRNGVSCLNIKGACGCSHAEPRVLMDACRMRWEYHSAIMLCTYSPCVNCANIILDSGIVCGVVYKIFAPHWAQANDMLRGSSISVVCPSEEPDRFSDLAAAWEERVIECWI